MEEPRRNSHHVRFASFISYLSHKGPIISISLIGGPQWPHVIAIPALGACTASSTDKFLPAALSPIRHEIERPKVVADISILTPVECVGIASSCGYEGEVIRVLCKPEVGWG
jgi:hypothetical protein